VIRVPRCRGSRERTPRIELGESCLEGNLRTLRLSALTAVTTCTARRQGVVVTAWSPIQESNLIRSHTKGEHDLRADGAFVETQGNAPYRLACKAGQRPFASVPIGQGARAANRAQRPGRVLRNRTPSCRFGICLATIACTLLGPPRYSPAKAFTRLPEALLLARCLRTSLLSRPQDALWRP